MSRWRRGSIVRAVVMLLLLWTGLDITNASLCALEQEDETPYSQTQTTTTIDADGLPDAPLAPQAPHVDDCFCCSHCVEVQALTPVFLPVPVSRDLDRSVSGAPRLFGARLYHPPLL